MGKSIDENFLADVIHKIKNSLGGIGGFAALLERDLGSNDPRRRLVQRIQEGVNKVNEVVVSLMTLVREVEPCFKNVQLQSLLKEAWKETWGDEEKGTPRILFHPDLADSKIELLADPEMIREVVFHAIRFTDLIGGRIEAIKVNPQPRKKVNLEFYFLNGCLSESTSENIFLFMNDCEPVEARLSLAIILKIVKLHGGRVSIVSHSKNQKVLAIQLSKGS